VWRPQLEGLSNQFTVTAWDAPEAGQSSDPSETSEWTLRLRLRRRGKSKHVVVGHLDIMDAVVICAISITG
jgi:hypothetical protein